VRGEKTVHPFGRHVDLSYAPVSSKQQSTGPVASLMYVRAADGVELHRSREFR